MKYTWRIGKIPDGNTPLANQSVAVRKISDGTTITTLTTDTLGFCSLTRDGHLEPFYLHLADVPGGDKFWRSDESHTVSVLNPKELPVALRVLGDGVIRGYGSELAVALTGGGPSFTISDGAASVAGTPFVQYTASTAFSVSRPVTSTRVDRIIIRLYPEGSATTPGKADIAVLAGVEGSAATALTQTATVHEVGLYTLTVPTAGAVTLADTRDFAGDAPPITGITRSNAETTTNASGEILTNLNTSLVLPRTGTYDVEAWVSATQDNGGGWVLQATYGSFGAGTSPIQFNTPAQVAVNSTGKVYVADTSNNRLVRLNSNGTYDTSITSLTDISGVCVDGSDNVYVSYGITTRKYNSSLALQWTVVGVFALHHLATDGTFLYQTRANTTVAKLQCSDGAVVSSWGSAGTGNGQFDTPWGIVYSNSEIYVCDQVNARVQVFNPTGTYQRQWSLPTDQCLGLAVDSAGHIIVADFGASFIYRYSTTGVLFDLFAQATPEGIGVATGDVLWVSNRSSHNVAKWDENAAGYGGLAVEIDGNLGTYITLGDLDSMLQNSHVRTATGPATISVRVYGKATSGTATFRSVVLSARAVPRS